MLLLTRGLPVLLEIGLLVYCLIDCIQTPSGATRHLEKPWWLLIIVVLPVVGGIAWLVAGRPDRRPRHQVPWPSRTAGFPEWERPRRALGPDDDPEFLAGLREEELRRRERPEEG